MKISNEMLIDSYQERIRTQRPFDRKLGENRKEHRKRIREERREEKRRVREEADDPFYSKFRKL